MIRNSRCSTFNRRTIDSSIEIHQVTWNFRRIPLSYARHITGRYSPGHGRSSIPFESLLERSAIVALLGLPFIDDVQAQPVTVTYSVSRALRTYTPDIFVRMKYVPPSLSALGWENLTLVEVKPAKVVTRHSARIRFKLRIAEMATNLPGVCLTESEIQLLVGLAKGEGRI